MNDTFIFANTIFAEKENDKLIKTIIWIKFKKKLLNEYLLMFNRCIIKKNKKIIKFI